jgi:nucleotide-binding universal stress UspA family protein
MCTHGRTGLSHVLMGSTAEAVVRRAHCPVLTLRQPMPVAASKRGN